MLLTFVSVGDKRNPCAKRCKQVSRKRSKASCVEPRCAWKLSNFNVEVGTAFIIEKYKRWSIISGSR